MKVVLVILAVMFAMKAEAKGPSCALVKRLAAQYSTAELERMAENYGLSAREIAAAKACLKDKK